MNNNRQNFFFSELHPLRPGYLLSLFALSLALSGCAVIKRDHYDVPVIPLPAQFKNAPETVSPSLDSPSSAEAKSTPLKSESQLDPVLVEWWHVFGSSELEGLITRGLANNPDVRILTYKIAQAKVRSEQARAGKGPTITAPIGVTEQFPYYGVGGPVTQGLPYNGPNGEKVKQLFQASIRGDWRVDLWGELDSLAQSSNLQLWRASFERDNAQGNVAANIASSYVEYLSLNDRIRIARETETVLSGMLAAVEGRLEGGDATAIDMEQQKAAVYAVRATIPVLEQQREDALGNIAFLIGTVPESLKLSDNGLDSLPLPTVIPGVPSTLLLRRPDVRMAEARLLAADADIDVARARVLPPLDLTAQVGYGSYYLSQLFKPEALFWNAMANLSISIFDGGKQSKEKDYAQAVHEEMVETYVRTLYQAVREVDSALNAIRQTGKSLEAQRESADAARRAWDYSSEVYAVGAIDYLTLLDTERTYHQHIDEFHRIRKDRYTALVNLFHALGGGVPPGEKLPGKGVRPSIPDGNQGGSILASPEKSPAMTKSAPTLLQMDHTLSNASEEKSVSTSISAVEGTKTSPSLQENKLSDRPSMVINESPPASDTKSTDVKSATVETIKSASSVKPISSIEQAGITARPEAKNIDAPNVTPISGYELPSLWEQVLTSLPEFPVTSLQELELPSFSLPELPSVSLPEFESPLLLLPEIKTVSLPELELPSFSLPELPTMTLPDFELLPMSLPDIESPLIAAPEK